MHIAKALTMQQLADRVLLDDTSSEKAAREMVRRVDADCFTELVARSGLATRMTPAAFAHLDRAFTAHLQEREIRAHEAEIRMLPETGEAA